VTGPADVAIRVADPAAPDAATLVSDFFAAIAALYPGFDPARQPAAPLEGFTAARNGVFLVADLDGAPVGCAGLQQLDAATAELRRVFVRDEARGRGVGRALLDEIATAARALGYERIRLDTGDRLHAARALFLAAGFREIEDYNGNPYAAHWMELELR
jgi:GNAT superfamily N-acetyltransferase